MENQEKLEKLEEMLRRHRESQETYLQNSDVDSAFAQMENAAFRDGTLSRAEKELIAIGIAVPWVLKSQFSMFVYAALMGLGYGIYMVVDQALNVDVLPNPNEAGKALGILFCGLSTVVNADHLRILVYHSCHHLFGNILTSLAYCKNSVITDSHNIALVDFFLIQSGVSDCVCYLSGLYILDLFQHCLFICLGICVRHEINDCCNSLWNCLCRDYNNLFFFYQ